MGLLAIPPTCSLLPQGLCTCCSQCLERSALLFPYQTSVLHSGPVSAVTSAGSSTITHPHSTLFLFTLPYFSKVPLNVNMACGSEPHLSYPQGPLRIHGLRALGMGPVQVGMWLCRIHSRFLWLDTPEQWKTALQYFSLFFFFKLWHTAQYVELPWPRTELVTPVVEVWSLNHWTPRQVHL